MGPLNMSFFDYLNWLNQLFLPEFRPSEGMAILETGSFTGAL